MVLLAACGVHAAVRPLLVSQRAVPWADPRRGGSQDVQVAGQCRRAVASDRALRGGRVPLVLLHLETAVGRLPVLTRDDWRGRPAVPSAAVERVWLLRPVRERQRDRAAGRSTPRPPQRPRPLV